MMNIRKFFKVRNYYLLLGVIMINVGCTKNFLEYNTNPNEATDEMTDWDNVRTGSLLLQMEQNVLVVAQPGLNIGSDRYQTVEVWVEMVMSAILVFLLPVSILPVVTIGIKEVGMVICSLPIT